MDIIEQLKEIEKNYLDSEAFHGGRVFTMQDTSMVTVYYPTTEVWSSLIDYVMNNPNHQVSIVTNNIMRLS